MQTHLRVLLIGGSSDDARTISESSGEFDVVHRSRPKEAAKDLIEAPYDVVVLDAGHAGALPQIAEAAGGTPVLLLGDQADERQGADCSLIRQQLTPETLACVIRCAASRRKAAADLTEREKELRCLYALGRLIEAPGIGLDDIYRGVIELIPSALQYPDDACARIIVYGREFHTEPFAETRWRLESPIVVYGEPAGRLDTCYFTEHPDADKGAFLKEERMLVDAITERLGRVTERIHAEETLRESEERYRSIFTKSLAPMLLIDPENAEIVDANAAASTYYGYPHSTLTALRITDINTLDREEVFAEMERARSEERNVFLFRHRLANGEIRDVEVYSGAITVGGRPLLHSIIHDITERKVAERAIRDRNRQLSIINRIIGTASRSGDAGELMEKTLEQALELLNFEGAEIAFIDAEGRPVPICRRGIAAEMREETGPLPCDRVAETRAPIFEEDFPLLCPGGGAEGSGSCAGLPLASDGTMIGVMTLISTRRHRFTDEEKGLLIAIGQETGRALDRLMLQRQLEQANEQANFYLDVMAHDINNANTSSLLYASLLEEVLTGEEKQYAKKMLAGIRQSMEIIGNVSTIRRLQEENPPLRSVDLDTVIREMIRLIPEATVRYAGTDATILADDLLPEVFINLIGNSRKYGGTDVVIAIRVEELDGMVQVTVEDTGPGIPDAMKHEVFDRFRTGGRGRSGKGLGLYITRVLVERYGGSIRADDRVPGRPEEGAAIRFTLPKGSAGPTSRGG